MKVHTLDLEFRQEKELIAAYVVELGKDRPFLVETGPGSTLPALLKGLRNIGLEASEIRDVFVTHIHLDHAGAAGWWAQQGATIYAHPRAASHLVDPSKLIKSATSVYGDKMEEWWGEMLPCPEASVKVLKDGEVVKFGKHKVRALDTPGHARHHHAFLVEDVCFTGDTAGMRLPGRNYLSVTAAPPQFDPVAYQQSIEKLHQLDCASLFLTHFGEVKDVSSHLSQYALRIEEVYDAVADLMKEGLEGFMLQEAFREMEYQRAMQEGLSEEDWALYEKANATHMCADGIRGYAAKNL